MRVVVTGADGFLGWHTRVRLKTFTDHDVVAVPQDAWPHLTSLVAGADAVVHIAGINRAGDDEVEHGNRRLATELVGAIRDNPGTAPAIVYTNTIHADTDTPYGRGKSAAGAELATAAADLGVAFTDVRFPNLFGEHGRPAYNSFVATFVDAVVRDRPPASVDDREIGLLHVQGAAAAIVEALARPTALVSPAPTRTSVAEVLETLTRMREIYRTGELPRLDDPFSVDLFNTLRAALFPAHYPIPLTAHADERGRLVETVRSHGGPGQTFVSTSRPGVTRGRHYHVRKIERFVVLAGEARIRLRRVLTDETVAFDVSGESPVVVDMPTMWSHDITNTGDSELTTVFWTNELFDPQAPDTYPEPVESQEG